jgi:hypothetical protein
MRHVTSGGSKWSDHIETPHSKGPSYWNRLESRLWHVNLLAKALTAIAFSDYVLGILKSSRPVETVPKGFGY